MAQPDYKQTFRCEVSYEIQGTIPAGMEFDSEIMNIEVIQKGDSLFFSDCKCRMTSKFSFKCDSINLGTLAGYGEITENSFYGITINKRKKQYELTTKYKTFNMKKVEVKINDQIISSNTAKLVTQEKLADKDDIEKRLLRLEISLSDAGDEFKLHSRNFYIGVGFMFGGGIISSAALYNGLRDEALLGAAVSVIGMVFIMEAHVHIRRAGVILNQNGIGISVPFK